MDLVDAGLRHPAHAERDEGPEERLGGGVIGDEVVVHEEEVASLLRLDLGHDLVDAPHVVAVVEVGAHGAVLAAEGAASSELQERDRQVALARVEVPAGLAARLRGPDGRVVARLQPALVGIGHDLCPTRLGVARVDGVGMRGDLVRQRRGVDAAHDHGHAAGAELVGDLVGAAGGEGFDRDAHEVRGLVVVDDVDTVVPEAHVDAGRRQPGDDAQVEGLHAPLVHERPVRPPTQRGLDQGDLHRHLPG